MAVVLSTGGFAVYVAVTFVVGALRGQDVSGWPIATAMAVCGAALGYRLATLSFRAADEELVVHNYWRTHRVPVVQVEGFDLGRATGGSLWTVRLLTGAGAIPIDVMSAQRRIWSISTPATAELERRRQELADWLVAARALGATTGSPGVPGAG